MRTGLLFALVLCVNVAVAIFQRDPPVVGQATIDVQNWILIDDVSNILGGVFVPGDLVNDLTLLQKTAEPLLDNNWISQAALWWNRTWTYSTKVVIPSSFPRATLVFDGIKMLANVRINGKLVATSTNQFVRHTFDLDVSSTRTFNIDVEFPAFSNASITPTRFMACSGGWDWGPYSPVVGKYGERFFSRGIWKNVYVVQWSDVLIESVVPQVTHVPDSNGSSGVWAPNFNVNVTVNYRAFGGSTFEVVTDWPSTPVKISVPTTKGASSKVSALFSLNKTTNFRLWRPLTRNQLHNVMVFNTATTPATVSIGFRSVELVTTKSPSSAQGSGNFTMRFVVNGAPMLMRGANFIPSSVMEGRVDGADLQKTVEYAAQAGMNILRVWGGGVYQYEDFYSACDRNGILVFQDMMSTSSGMDQPVPPPMDAASVEREVRYQVRRLSQHPSIFMYDSCNECGVAPVYQQVFKTLVQEDISRIVWPASPSNGWVSGVDSRGYPLSFGVSLVPADTEIYNATVEHHGPYLHGTGAPYVNDPSGKLVLFDPLTPPPTFPQVPVGFSAQGAYISEFGCVAMSSSFSMDATLSPANRDLHSTAMLQRNYPCDNLMDVYFGGVSQNWTMNLYACNMAQLLHLGGQIANFRVLNMFGLQIWQLNEIWPTGGWGTLETAAAAIPRGGQITGGRWKPLHYGLRDYLYNDLFLACDESAHCFVRLDSSDFYKLGSIPIRITFQAFDLQNKGKSIFYVQSTVSMNAFDILWFCGADLSLSSSNCPAWSTVFNVNTTILQVQASSPVQTLKFVLPLAPPANLQLPNAGINVDTSMLSEENLLLLTASDVAAWVFVAADGCMALTNNLFLFPGKTEQVQMVGKCIESSIQVYHAHQYMSQINK